MNATVNATSFAKHYATASTHLLDALSEDSPVEFLKFALTQARLADQAAHTVAEMFLSNALQSNILEAARHLAVPASALR